ncbi:endolytic transglycosylase MltG [Enterococcus italicus]|uniref:endolytic transglycosylase MltG n=1 Tax=Enterococcus italicus TaxID=246144 RepID=UPI0020731675|nr:endolytic transglycosylase MltG [Enterococcus italicus]MCM6880493.1 endolytic transglycosylase MltG [Enterococcus italicus]
MKNKKQANSQNQKHIDQESTISGTPRDVRRSLRKKEDKLVRKITISVLLIILIVGGVLIFNIYNYIVSSLEPLNAKSEQKVEVVIPNGSSNKAIGEILEKEKIIKSGMVFNYYTKFNNLTGFQAGTYQFSASMDLDAISEALKNGDVTEKTAQAKLTIPEGYDIDQIGDVIAEKTAFTKNDFLSIISDTDFFNTLLASYPSLLQSASEATDVRYRLEGYLFPATYNYYDDMTLKELVTAMVAKTDSVMSKYYTQIKQKNMSVHEVLTLASLVEKEGVTDDDRKNIAQVFFNRIAADMPLQSDISILYSLGEHKEDVMISDTQVDSPYNLYTNTGYGPGPFDNPSEQSIQAVLDPTANNYYYFVADTSTGKVYFAATYDEHLVNKEKYVDNQ